MDANALFFIHEVRLPHGSSFAGVRAAVFHARGRRRYSHHGRSWSARAGRLDGLVLGRSGAATPESVVVIDDRADEDRRYGRRRWRRESLQRVG